MLKTATLRIGLALLALFVTIGAAAETGYVTDTLSLGLHRAADTSDSAFRTLRSGDSFEILSRNGYYAQVRTADGDTGYVKVAYVVTDKPAKLIVAETAAQRDKLAAELADLKSAFAEPAARLESMQQQAAQLEAAAADATSRADELAETNQRLLAKEARYRHSLPVSWVGGAMLICLVAGALLGVWWVDRQSRRRHGGIRVV
jgi:SH3 domain protein